MKVDGKFIKDITHRDGEGSSKKLWYNIACAVASVIMVYVAYTLPYERGMDDWVFVWLFGVYLVTVGGFEILVIIMKLFIDFRSGKSTPTQKEGDQIGGK